MAWASGAHAAELGVGLVDEDHHLVQRLQHAPQPLEDHVGLAEPLAADVLQHQHRHVQFGGHGLEDERLAAADRPGHAGPGQAPLPAGAETRDQFLAEELLQLREADHVVERVGRLLELDDVLAELGLDELLDLVDHVAGRSGSPA